MIILQFVLFFKLIKFKMSNIEEIKIVLGNRGVYTNYKNDDVVLNLKFKSLALTYQQCIVCAEYSLDFLLSKNWVFNFIMPFDKRIITEFLIDFARNVIITDDEYITHKLHHVVNFRNRIGQHEYE